MVWLLPHGISGQVREAHRNILLRYYVLSAMMEGGTKVLTCHSNLWEDTEGALAGSDMIARVESIVLSTILLARLLHNWQPLF